MAKVVAFSGSHGTGKSTLIEELRKDSRYICLDSVTRTTTNQAERRIDPDADLDQTQLRIFEAIKVNALEITRLKWDSPRDKVIAMDRSFVDFYAYCKNFYVRNLISHKTFDKISEWTSRLTGLVDTFFYLPIEFNLVDDGVRNMNETLRQGVDTVIREELFKIGRTVELTGNLQQRLRRINTTLWS